MLFSILFNSVIYQNNFYRKHMKIYDILVKLAHHSHSMYTVHNDDNTSSQQLVSGIIIYNTQINMTLQQDYANFI